MGFSMNDAMAIPWSKDLEDAIVFALLNDDPLELGRSLFVIQGCVRNGSLNDGSLDRVVVAAWGAARKLNLETTSNILRALRMIAPFSVKEHSSEVARYLQAENPIVRLEAVWLAGFDCDRFLKELRYLKDDMYFGEVNIAGRLEFEIRNAAFETLSRRFGNTEKSHLAQTVNFVGNNAVAYYWDWEPLLRRLPKS
jgi:hypothetical protein